MWSDILLLTDDFLLCFGLIVDKNRQPVAATNNNDRVASLLAQHMLQRYHSACRAYEISCVSDGLNNIYVGSVSIWKFD